ncbi:hypothetical protein CLOP_g3418 [Closterium sp. NIES-67]|nr:hypothetical protein CLOP_g3418 [Closterium sp. NIES-67]
MRCEQQPLQRSLPASISLLTSLQHLSISGSGLTCPADGSKCVVQQSNATSFCPPLLLLLLLLHAPHVFDDGSIRAPDGSRSESNGRLTVSCS